VSAALEALNVIRVERVTTAAFTIAHVVVMMVVVKVPAAAARGRQ